MLKNITKEQAMLILKNRVLLHAALIQKDYDVPALSSALGATSSSSRSTRGGPSCCASHR